MAAGHGINFIEKLVGPEKETLFSGGLAAALIIILAILARKRLDRNRGNLVPDEGLTLLTIAELPVLFVQSLGDQIMGKEGRKYHPFLPSIFLFVLVCNMIGLVPGLSMPTDSFLFNLGIAIPVFVLYTAWGIKEIGIVSYLKHLWGPSFMIGFLLFPVEIISHLIRPLSLSIRLFGNMTGDHMVLGAFLKLTKVGVPVIFYLFGTFVCFVQAFVFTLLTMIYIRLATAHEESH